MKTIGLHVSDEKNNVQAMCSLLQVKKRIFDLRFNEKQLHQIEQELNGED